MKLMIGIVLAGLSLQQCATGCLKCNALNQCQVCDLSNNYFLSGNACALSTQTNCALLGVTGNCAVCANNFFLDPNTSRCVAVSSAALIANCAQYANAQTCNACAGNFFVASGRCVAVNATVANCQTYAANGLCAFCATGFVANVDSTACVAVPANANCQAYTFVGCSRCAAGFVTNPNLYFWNYNATSTIYAFWVNYFNQPFGWQAPQVCQAVTVQNCLSYSAYNACVRCAAGFYLQSGNCVAFPLPIVFACANYTSLTTCSGCQSGYYLSSNACVANTVISNCLAYSGAASSTTCVACNNGYFLQGNICVNRTVSNNINNCQTASVAADTCAACTSGFVLTTDGRACLAALANCATYASSTFQTTTLQCSLCNRGFYLTSSGAATVCTAGTVQFCATYQINANTCTSCNNGYYLTGSLTCVAHVNIPNCATYDPSQPNRCAVCNSGFYNFIYTTVCVAASVVNNCAAYTPDGAACSTCNPGFYVNAGTCTAIPSTFSNCQTFSGATCTLCNSGYMVDTLPVAGTCVLPLDYINVANNTNSPCYAMAAVAATSSGNRVIPTWSGAPSTLNPVLTCQACNNYMYGYTPLSAEAICVQTAQLNLYSGFSTVANCLRYGISYAAAQPIVCMQCTSGFFLSGYDVLAEKTTATTCTNTCSLTSTTSTAAVFVDDMVGFVNICVAPVDVSTTGNFLAHPGVCNRYARTSMTKIGIIGQLVDYACFGLTAGSATYPAQTLLLINKNGVSGVGQRYWYESPSATAQITVASAVPFYAGSALNRVTDANSVTPNVFNYLGDLQSAFYTTALLRPFHQAAANGVTADTAFSTTNVNLNNLSFCEIVGVWDATNDAAIPSSFSAGATGFTAATLVQYACVKCLPGYMVSFTQGSTVATTAPFPSCVQMSNCASTSTIYGGLTPFLNTVVNCHTCSQSASSTLFPTVYIEVEALAATSTGNFIGFQASNRVTLTSGTVTVDPNSGFKCAAAPSAVLVSTTGTSTSSVTNCAVYGNFRGTTAKTPAEADYTTAYSICLACAANYFPTYMGAYAVAAAGVVNTVTNVPAWAVTACTLGQNCDVSAVTQFNSCARCNTALDNLVTPTFYGFHDHTLTNCYQVSTRNCFILSSSSFTTTGTNSCEVCKAGFFLNVDGACESLRVPNQSPTAGTFVNAYASSLAYPTAPTAATLSNNAAYRVGRIHNLLSFRQLQYGVTACNSGYTFMPANAWAPRLCVFSSYVYNNTGNFPSTSRFIANCVRYNLNRVNNNFFCAGCNTGFIPTLDGTACLSSAAIPNCVIAQNGNTNTLCASCVANFLNVGGSCVSTTIPNCAAYVNTVDSYTTPSTLQCKTCINGFVLSTDGSGCTPGSVSNCNQYLTGNPSACSTCASGYVLIFLNNNVYYCYPIPATLNCNILQDTSPNSGANYGTISCAACATSATQVYGIRTWTSLGLTNAPQSLCMPFTTIPNCATYSQSSPVIKANTFGCLTCNSGFWFSATNSSCVARANLPSQCTAFSPNSDTCTACSSGSFLSVDGTNCVAFPNGIFQCAVYSAAATCTQCNPGYFLVNNACAISTTINNCAVYSANFTCSACASGFFLVNATSCASAVASNCLSYVSINACASCPAGFGLQTTNAITSCVVVNLPNCANATTVAPFTCLTCNNGFFPNSNGVCTAVSSLIANCIAYDSATTCSACASNAVLNVARTACNATYFSNYVDPNCAQNFQVANPVCTNCAPGSFFVNNTCTSCSNNTYAAGCYNCDPGNNAVCLMCRPGYYMNAQGACVNNNPTPVPTPTNGTNSTNASAATFAAGVAVSLAVIFFDLV